MDQKESQPSRLHRLKDFIQMVFLNFSRDKCLILASSVVYVTLIAIVPFLAFIVSMLTAFGVFNTARASLLELVEQQFGEMMSAEITDVLNSLVLNAMNVGVVGLISFLITSAFLVNRVWVSINQIYHTSMDRNQLGRFTQFVTFLVVGTILVSVYFSMNALMSDFIREFLFVNQFVQVIGSIGPWIVMWLFLFILIFAVPNTKVTIRSALIGSVVGTVSFQLVSQVFSRVVLEVVDYSIIYGSFAAILITLIWIYLWWIIIFGAVEVAYVHQYRPGKREKRGLPNPPAEQIARGFEILRGMAAHFKDGKGAVNVLDLGNQLKITDRTLNTYLDVLERAGYILRIDRTGHHYVPSRPLNDLPADQIARTLYGEVTKSKSKASPGERIATQILHKGVGDLTSKTLDDIS